MSMMWPPQRVKITSIPSARSALATRWPPEIISGSVSRAAGASACTAVLVAVTLELLPLGSVQTSCGPLHVIGQIERVLADEALRELRVAGLERLDDVHVVDDRALRAAVFADHAAANGPHMHEEARHQAADFGGTAELDDALVEAQVCLRVL